MIPLDEAAALHDPMPSLFVPRRTEAEQFRDWFSYSQTCRRIANRYTADAKQYEASGNRKLYLECVLEARNYWRRTWLNFDMARRRYPRKWSAANA